MAMAIDAWEGSTILAEKVTAPGLRMAKPIPIKTAPTHMIGKLVDKPTKAVPIAIKMIAAPMVKRLNVLTTLPKINPPRIPIPCMMADTVPAVLASPI